MGIDRIHCESICHGYNWAVWCCFWWIKIAHLLPVWSTRGTISCWYRSYGIRPSATSSFHNIMSFCNLCWIFWQPASSGIWIFWELNDATIVSEVLPVHSISIFKLARPLWSIWSTFLHPLAMVDVLNSRNWMLTGYFEHLNELENSIMNGTKHSDINVIP